MNIPSFLYSGLFGVSLGIFGVAQAESDFADPDITLLANEQNRVFGSAFSTAGDINGDGVMDVAVSDPYVSVNGEFSSGSVHIVSGSDGVLLRTYDGSPFQSQLFGGSMASLDSNGDGVLDLAVGAAGRRSEDGLFGAGAVTIYSGASGEVLVELVGAGGSRLGSAVINAGDQDGDGVEDLFVTAPFADDYKGQVLSVSGADGSVIRILSSDVPSFRGFASAIASSGDIDGDGRNELVVATPGYSDEVAFGAGRVQLVRSSDATVEAEIVGFGLNNRLGSTLAPAADINEDGVPEVMVGSTLGGTLLLVSGSDLSIVRDLSPELVADRTIYAGGSVDFDGDEVQDWLFGSPGMGYNDAGIIVGGIKIISGADGSTLLERLAVSPITALGQSQTVLGGVGVAVGESRLANPETGGSGAAYIWLVGGVIDSDGDGIPDDEDENPFSNTDPTIHILGTNTGVDNFVGDGGVTLADRFDELGAPNDYANSTHYFTSIVQLTNKLVEQGLISGRDRKAINAAARDGAVQVRGKGGR